jgi:hypothetical protein
MVGEDILDNYSDEEEIDAGVAAPCRRKVLFYTLEKKRQIVNDAAVCSASGISIPPHSGGGYNCQNS